MKSQKLLSQRAYLLALLLIGLCRPILAQTNDPLVGSQSYLFDVHKIDKVWTYTTGSASNRIGVYSMLGFLQNHEDLSGRVQTPVGEILFSELDYATETVGIAGANTNNSRGIAGIDRLAKLQSYSLLSTSPTFSTTESVVSYNANGLVLTYYLDLNRLSTRLNTGRTNGVNIHLFSFGVPSGKEEDYAPAIPSDLRPGSFPDPDAASSQDMFNSSLQTSLETIFGTLCGTFGPFDLGNCASPPGPLESFRESIGNAVKLGNGVEVAPAGDLNDALQPPTPYLPAMMDKYALALGGVKKNNVNQVVEWPRTRPASYVDVAGFAENVVGPSGSGTSQYNTAFGGTAAAASIGAGVALKAYKSSLSGEDIEEILERTARDVGASGRDDYTGYGYIDAEAALNLVRNNNVQRSKIKVAFVSSDVNTNEQELLQGFNAYIPSACSNYPFVWGTRHEFTARLNFTKSFTAAPKAWLRWADSDGLDTRSKVVDGDITVSYDPFDKALTVLSVDQTGMTVKGNYWFAEFYNALGQKCSTTSNIPTTPSNFNLAYTAIGVESTTPPLSITISGPLELTMHQTGTLTANAIGGSNYTYLWYYRPGGTGSWINTSTTTSSFSVTMVWTQGVEYKVDVTSNGTTVNDTHFISYGLAAPGTMPPPGKTVSQLKTSFEAAWPNPFNPTTELHFTLAESGLASLIVYDMAGREVTRLVDGWKAAGHHQVPFEAGYLPSGIYLARLKTEGFVQTQRLVLLK
jgi:hypothetical protein